MRYIFLAVALMLGVLLRLSHVTDPFHEMVHVTVAEKNGVEAHVTGWSTTDLSSFEWTSIFAGWSAELWFGCVVAVLFAVIGRISKSFWFTGGAGLGFAVMAWLWAFNSVDFMLPRAFIYAMPGLSETQKYFGWMRVHEAINQRWMVVGLVLLGITALIVVVLARKHDQSRSG